MTIAGVTRMTGGDPQHLQDAVLTYLGKIRGHIAKAIGEHRGDNVPILRHEAILNDLEAAAIRFRQNRRLDDAARTDRDLVEELKDFAKRSDTEMTIRLALLPATVVDALCGVFPGHRLQVVPYRVSDQGSSSGGYLLPDDDALLTETLKNLWRSPADGPGRGQVMLRRTERIAECIPVSATSGMLCHLIGKIVDAIEASASCKLQIHANLTCLSEPFLRAGSKGSPILHQAAVNLYREAAADQTLGAVMRETLPLIIQDMDTWIEGVDGVAREVCIRAITRLLDEVSTADRRRVLQAIQGLDTQAFRACCQRLTGAISLQYGGEGEQRGKERDTRRWSEAHAGWHLIVEVLETAWPPELGSLDNRSKPAVIELIQATMDFADPSLPVGSGIKDRVPKDAITTSEREDVHNRANAAVNAEHVSDIASMRLAVFELNSIMAALDRELLWKTERISNPDPAEKERAQHLRRTVEALQTWRRELTRRLRQGDYLKGAAGRKRKRATGPKIEIPVVPPTVRRLPAVERREAICALALNWSQRAPGPVGTA